MKRHLLLAIMIAILWAPLVTFACNCQATRAQRWLAYKAYKEQLASQRERVLAEQRREHQRKINAPRKASRKDSASIGERVEYDMQPKGK